MKTKIILTILYLSTLVGYVLAQTPGFNYQAVLRNAAGETMTNAEVTLHFSLIDGPSNTVIYKENQALTTDDLGILTCMIGTGTIESGTFAEITGVQDLNIKIEAELPGETGVTEIGESRIGAIPYALYGKDEDSDPGNEMQELSLEGDSLKIRDMGGVSIDQINYWQKTDSSYILSTDDLSNGRSFQPGSYEISGARYKLKSEFDDSELNTYILGHERKIEGQVIDREMFFTDGETELDSYLRMKMLERFPFLNLKNTAGSYRRNAVADQVALAEPNSQELYYLNTFLRNAFAGGDITENGCNLFAGAGDSKFTNLFSDNVLGGVGADVYKIGVDAFGYGFGVFCFEEGNTSPRSQAATFGGTMSTANDNGLTTLVGALPGFDPTNGYNIIFNGQNLGVSSTINSELAGTSSTYGSNGQLNTTAGTFAGDADGGALITYDQSGNRGAYVWTKNDGTSQVGADQFVMTTSPPGRSDQVAAFSALVGGEAAAYDRGTAKLVNGEATVICPEHFGWVADENSMTVTITPLSADSKGIAVIEKSNGGFKVKELNGGTGNYSFDYLVMCKRKGLEEYEVVRKKPQIMPDNSTAILQNIPKGPLKSIRDLVPTKSTN